MHQLFSKHTSRKACPCHHFSYDDDDDDDDRTIIDIFHLSRFLNVLMLKMKWLYKLLLNDRRSRQSSKQNIQHGTSFSARRSKSTHPLTLELVTNNALHQNITLSHAKTFHNQNILTLCSLEFILYNQHQLDFGTNQLVKTK